MLSLRVSGLPTAVGERPRCVPDDGIGWGTTCALTVAGRLFCWVCVGP